MEKDQLSRKLAVILDADVVDSISLARQDEALAHQRIQNTSKRLLETIRYHYFALFNGLGFATAWSYDRSD